MGGKRSVVSLRERLSDAVDAALKLNEELELTLPHPLKFGASSRTHGKVSVAPIPWYSAGAFLILELHAEAREREAVFKLMAGHPVRDRGGSSVNTRKALESALATAYAVDDGRVHDFLRWLNGWSSRARIALGEKDAPRRLPRERGLSEPKCPWCKRFTLRLWALYGEVKCINPACKDEVGRRPKAVMEVSQLNGDWILVWQDNGVGLPV